MEARRIIW